MKYPVRFTVHLIIINEQFLGQRRVFYGNLKELCSNLNSSICWSTVELDYCLL